MMVTLYSGRNLNSNFLAGYRTNGCVHFDCLEMYNLLIIIQNSSAFNNVRQKTGEARGSVGSCDFLLLILDGARRTIVSLALTSLEDTHSDKCQRDKWWTQTVTKLEATYGVTIKVHTSPPSDYIQVFRTC